MAAEEMHRPDADSHSLPNIESHSQPDPMLQTLAQQMKLISQAKGHFTDGLHQLTEAERSLTTLIPALEIQIRGWTNEIQQLHQRLQETEATYAEVVDKLDARLRRQQVETNRQLDALSASYQQKTDSLETQIKALQEQLSQQKPPARPQGKSFSILPDEEE